MYICVAVLLLLLFLLLLFLLVPCRVAMNFAPDHVVCMPPCAMKVSYGTRSEREPPLLGWRHRGVPYSNNVVRRPTRWKQIISFRRRRHDAYA
jgi:hypothetical protein